ncbi:Holliday junction resolvase RuvX [Natronoglycomyces albus]|uniref:Putative pre-16S rRNA nuclease n=1 Tax=Natronoglycomyces albus TaxID=2811108 RepID=A0A895XJZ4_9ACTN|nr:Holliday junction resolvase RuvX [Natronoglycomyces albus]QSB03883.1 Holliday junction resolvase RuvX [Natronoglycomyces albus]
MNDSVDPAATDSQWRRGRRLGIDIGKVRIGVAACDPDGILASPVATVSRDLKTKSDNVPQDLRELAAIIDEYEAVEVIVGLPVTLSGEEGLAASHTREWVSRLTEVIDPVPVRLIDERLTTAVATRRLAERGVRGKRRRAVVDQAAAVEILQQWLELHRKA